MKHRDRKIKIDSQWTAYLCEDSNLQAMVVSFLDYYRN